MLRVGIDTTNNVIQHSNGTVPLLFPLTINSENQAVESYQVHFSPNAPFVNSNINAPGIIHSQKLRYRASEAAAGIGTATAFDVFDHSLIIKPETNNQQAYLEMGLRWNIASLANVRTLLANSVDNTLLVQYELKNSLTPNNPNSITFSTVTLSITPEDVGNPDSRLSVIYTNQDDEVLGEGFLAEVLDQSTNSISYQASFRLTVDASRRGFAPIRHFVYPNIYFITTTPISVNGVAQTTNPSIHDTITLNDIGEATIPPQQNVRLSDAVTTSVANGDERDEVSFRLNFELAGNELRNYIVNTHNELLDRVELRMNIYISQNEEFMRTELHTLDYEARRNASSVVQYNPNFGRELIFSDINGKTAMAGNPLDALRDNRVVKVENISITPEELETIISNGNTVSFNYLLDGLDKNQVYYLYMDTVVEVEGLDQPPTISLLSNLVSILTLSDEDIPDDNNRVPSAPSLQSDINGNTAMVFWDRVSAGNTSQQIEYEIIRLNGEQIPGGLLNDRSVFNVFWSQHLVNMASRLGLRTDAHSLLRYNGNSFTPVNINDFEYDLTTEMAHISDKTTVPNQIYFYYVRTVAISNDIELYSTWSHISVTTTPVRSPINLLIEDIRNGLNPRTEVAFSFDAPVPSLESIGNGYTLQYQLRQDGEDWSTFVTMNRASTYR